MASSDLPDSRDDEPQPLRLIVLAGHGPGAASRGVDALAARFGKSHRCLVPLAGRPLIAHVLQTAAQHPRVTSLAICVEREAFDPVWDVLTQLPGRGTVALVEAQADIASSVRAAAKDWDGPLLVTTADHALLSAESIDVMIEALETADVAFALTSRAAVEAAHSGAQRGFITLHDGDYAACDLYGMASAHFVDAVKVFRGVRTDREALRIWRAIGLVGFLMVRLGMETLAGAIVRASRRLGMRVRAVVLADGTQAIDVDDERTYAIVRELLGDPGEVTDLKRESSGSSKAAFA
ncbi:MobA-like NTP transferase protein [Novosphingobium sp. PhB165]|uniref:NTP transferase domain-containing protein n=1 Tax=Novosphingobium sp. PhB165 TaxID=2485105 RepID=UPI00105408E6|nr:NTP transferase domain-containing protein [Novosphingobium sp. PhB165]TCM19807.1 MobA-like NTP transferase protein [Novosphingobium sp. PhB165]